MSVAHRNYEAGQFIFHEGDPSKSIFIVLNGTVAIRKRKGSAYIEIAKVFSNEVIGELSFFDRQPRSAAAVALTDAELLEVPFEGLDRIYQNIPDYFRTIIASLAERLRNADDQIRKLRSDTVTGGKSKHGDDEGSSS